MIRFPFFYILMQCFQWLLGAGVLFVGTVTANEGDPLRPDLLNNYAEGMPFYYEGVQLMDNWQQLHHRDSIEYPTQQYVQQFYQRHEPANLGSVDEVALALQQSWRLYHAGQFRDAYDQANKLGLIGVLPKLRILSIHHHFFVQDKAARRDAFKALIKEIERVQTDHHYESAALYLLKAFCIGRYGQDINPVNAFAKGLGGKLKKNIDRAAELAPQNIEAMMFKAVFHAEVVAYVGGVTGRILYGSSRSRALAYFDQAIGEDRDNSSLMLEYGKACLKICKKKSKSEGIKVLTELVQSRPLEISDLKNIEIAQAILNQKS